MTAMIKCSTNLLVFLSVALLICLVNLSYVGPQFAAAYQYNDFAHFYTSASLLFSGESVYGIILTDPMHSFGLKNEPEILYATNPPALVFTTGLLLFFPPATAFYFWTALQISSFLGCSSILVYLKLKELRTVVWFCLFVGLFVSRGFLAHLEYGQTQLLLLALLLTGYLLSTLPAGSFYMRHLGFLILGFTCGLKLFSWPVIIFSLVLGGVSGGLLFILGAVLINLPVLCIAGVHPFTDFYEFAIPYIHQTAHVYSANISFSHAILWSLQQAGFVRDLIFYQVFISTAIQLLGACTLLYIYKKRRLQSYSGANIFSFSICMMLLMAPTLWPHYLVLLFIPFALLLVHSDRRLRMQLFLSWILLALANGKNPFLPTFLQIVQVWAVPLLLIFLSCRSLEERPSSG